MVLFDDPYLTRAWCVFEVASFIEMHSGNASRVKVISLPAIRYFIFYYFFGFISTLGTVVIMSGAGGVSNGLVLAVWALISGILLFFLHDRNMENSFAHLKTW